MTDHNRHLLALSAQIVSAHTGHNEVGIEVLTTIIRNVYNTLADLDVPRSQEPAPLRHTHAGENHVNHDHGGHDHSHPHNENSHPFYGQTVSGAPLILMRGG